LLERFKLAVKVAVPGVPPVPIEKLTAEPTVTEKLVRETTSPAPPPPPQAPDPPAPPPAISRKSMVETPAGGVQVFAPVAYTATKQLPPLSATTTLDVEEFEVQLPDPMTTDWALGATITAYEKASVTLRKVAKKLLALLPP
jgi:hypothetical protein